MGQIEREPAAEHGSSDAAAVPDALEEPGGPRGAGSALSSVPIVRALVGGGLMGIANLVPGISGGTMLVATGIYRAFIEAVSDVTRLRIRRSSVVLLALVVAGALVAIVAFAGAMTYLLAEARWAMYSLFIGLTLGGVPLLWKIAHTRAGAHWLGVAAGFAAMAALVFVQSADAGGAARQQAGPMMLFVGGAAGASAMILPGVSGAFLLLVLGLYETILTAVKDFLRAAIDADLGAMLAVARTLLPVGLGVLAGVAIVSAAVRFMLRRFAAFTIGSLLGLLLASPLGLYPFRDASAPAVGDTVGGIVVNEQNLAEFVDDPKSWPERAFPPSAVQVLGAIGLVFVGFGATMLIARLDRNDTGPVKPGAAGDQPDRSDRPD